MSGLTREFTCCNNDCLWSGVSEQLSKGNCPCCGGLVKEINLTSLDIKFDPVPPKIFEWSGTGHMTFYDFAKEYMVIRVEGVERPFTEQELKQVKLLEQAYKERKKMKMIHFKGTGRIMFVKGE